MNTQAKIETTKDLSIYQKLGMKTKSNQFTNWYNAGLLDNIDENFAKEIQDYWLEKYNAEADPALHMAYMNLTGKKDVRLIPERIMRREIMPVFNDYNMSTFYGDKNLYDTVIAPSRSVETVLRNINGAYFDNDHNSVDAKDAETILLNSETALIIKPSKTNNGTGIKKIIIQDKQIYLDDKPVTIKDLEEIYLENFIVQKAIEQHPNLAAPHPASVNTIRMVTFRWKNEIRYLLAFARFGSNNDVRDNGSVDISPRIGISDSGEFFKLGLSQNGQTFTHHPTTGFCFADLEPIPNFDEFKQFVIDSHKSILHLNLVSWDIIVGVDGKPIFLEANFAGTTSFYQLVTQRPFFGDLTDEVLEHVSKELKIKEPVLMLRHRQQIEEKNARKKQKELDKSKELAKQLKQKNKKLRKKRRDLKQKVEDQEKEISKIKKEHSEEVKQLKNKYTNIVNSKSYKYTKPLRKIAKWLK
ncbi:sugar-transfer associated ATP-grasp domain-containing protein [Amphibacillus sp. Q70]|uniref:sugar-transfer associated ATP-grasp domain-containing protein n=1 Tax=Amphibacillus sp. Q70 TaxID=3453416 RepID=UPI003F867CEA